MRALMIVALLVATPHGARAEVVLRTTSAAPTLRPALRPILAPTAATLARCAPRNASAGELVADFELPAQGGRARVTLTRADTLDRTCVERALAALVFPSPGRARRDFTVWWSLRVGQPARHTQRRTIDAHHGQASTNFTYDVTATVWDAAAATALAAWLDRAAYDVAECNPTMHDVSITVDVVIARGAARIGPPVAPAGNEGAANCIAQRLARLPIPSGVAAQQVRLDVDVVSRGGEIVDL